MQCGLALLKEEREFEKFMEEPRGMKVLLAKEDGVDASFLLWERGYEIKPAI